MSYRWDEVPNEEMQEMRRKAKTALASDIPETVKVRQVVHLFPGGTLHDGPSEYVEAVNLARKLQKESDVINCGACYAPEDCIGGKRCRRV